LNANGGLTAAALSTLGGAPTYAMPLDLAPLSLSAQAGWAHD
jgi:hypothetical protein